MKRTVTLVNDIGIPKGTADLQEAHDGEGMLHQAISVYVFRNQRSEILIQRRSSEKRLWHGFLANTCCSHPYEKESPRDAGQRRLFEELGFTCSLRPVGTLLYHERDPFGQGVEYEHVILLIGDVDENPEIRPNPSEVSEYRWADLKELQWEMAMADAHERFAPWFLLGLPAVLKNF